MKKVLTIAVAFLCLLGMVGCSQQPQYVQANQLLVEGNVLKIDVSSLPDGYNYSFDGEEAKEIIDYLSNLNLQGNFEENPNEYTGMTWVICLEYDNGDKLTVYHFGNMFIRTKEGSWYKMTYDEANRFDTLLDELNN